MQATASGCKPGVTAAGEALCRRLIDDIFARVIPATRPDAVLISANWGAADLPPLVARLKALRAHGQEVYVFGPVPKYQEALPWLLAASAARHDAALLQRGLAGGQAALDQAFQTAVAATGAHYISIYQTMCPPGDHAECATVDAAGTPLQFDYGHLTSAGSVWLAERLRQSGVIR